MTTSTAVPPAGRKKPVTGKRPAAAKRPVPHGAVSGKAGWHGGAENRGRLSSTTLKWLIGLATPSIENVRIVHEGVPMQALRDMDELLPGVALQIVPKSSLATLKKKSATLPANRSDRVYQTGKVLGLALKIYDGDHDKAREFMQRRHPMLNDQRPVDVALESTAGADLVMNILGRGAYGGGA